MKVAIIGTGNMASGLANLFASKNEEVIIGHRDPAKASELAEKLGKSIQGGGIDAAIGLADVIFLALPYKASAEVLSHSTDLAGKYVVDISNPVSDDFSELTLGHSTSAAEELQRLAPPAHIVKGFNTIFAQLLSPESRQDKLLQVFIAADNEAAKKTVFQLAQKAGFDAVDAGPLKNSRYLEPIGAMNIQFGYFLGWGPAAAPGWVKV